MADYAGNGGQVYAREPGALAMVADDVSEFGGRRHIFYRSDSK